MLSLLLASAMLAGCHSPRGAILTYSGGSATYQSTELMPKTVTIVDTRTEETVFTMDIPAGRQLTVQFFRDQGDDPVRTPDLMMYEVFDLGTRVGKLRNSLTVPNATCRRVDLDFREGPEAAPTPPSEMYRTDRLANRPPWWKPEGGPMPDADSKNIYDK
jgi:hypothetical protein